MGVDELVALPRRAAARLAGVSERQLRYWEDTDLLSPGIRRDISQRNRVRLYEFTDLLELLVIATLLDVGISLQHVRKVVEHLRERGYSRPLTEVRFAIDGDEVFFQHADGTWEGDRMPDQVVLHQVLQLEPLRQRIRETVGQREAERAGQVERRRMVLGSKPVFAGTRIPLSAVFPYLRRGYSTEQILEAFPELSRRDIKVARKEMPAA